jgi:hypothetical protein
MGLSLEELLEIEQNRKDASDGRLFGVETWELGMRRSGATDSEIDAKREKIYKAIRDIIGK